MDGAALNTIVDQHDAPVAERLKIADTYAPQVQFARKVLAEEAAAIMTARQSLDEAFGRAVELLLECEGHVVIAGVGKSGLIGQKLSATFSSLGSPSSFLHPTEALHGDLGRIRRGDVVLLLSNSGETEEVVGLATILRQDNVPLVSISKSSDTHLGRLSNAAISLGSISEACHLNLAPTSTTTAMLAVGDALALALSRAREFSEGDFHRSHPGGMLGKRMMPVSDFLRFRVGENLATAHEQTLVEQVLAEAEAIPRRCGAILVVANDGTLSGILTDADLRRLLLRYGSSLLQFTIGKVMTVSPVAVQVNQSIAEAIQVIREHRVDELPILAGDRKPVGVLDVQDLLALKLIDED